MPSEFLAHHFHLLFLHCKMGLCQCREAAGPSPEDGHQAAEKNIGSFPHGNFEDQKTPAKKRDLVILREGNSRESGVAGSPSEVTVPETPDSFASPTPSLTPHSSKKRSLQTPKHSNITSTRRKNDDYHDDEDYKSMDFRSPSLMHLQQLDSAIPEEVDPDAPSDEEEDFEQNVVPNKNTEEPGRIIPTSKRRPASPPRPFSSSSSRDPNSDIQHPPLVAPPAGSAANLLMVRQSSLNSTTMARFKMLQLKVKQAQKKHVSTSRKAKKQDRLEDVKGYRELWQQFEEIQATVQDETSESMAETTSPKKKETESPKGESPIIRSAKKRQFDLHNTSTWFFDFEQLIEQEEEADDDDDNQSLASQESLSLLSTASMDSQKRYYAEKQKLRSRREAGISVEKPSFQATLDAMEESRMANDDADSLTAAADDASSLPSELDMSFGKKMRRMLCTPTSIKFKRNSKTCLENRIASSEAVSDVGDAHRNKLPTTKPLSLGPVPDTAKARQMRGVRKARYRRSASYADSDDLSDATGDTDNDYSVPRRRREHYDPDDASAVSGIKFDITAKTPASGSSTRGVEPTSGKNIGETLATLELPPIVASSENNSPTWRKFPSNSIKDDVLMNNAAKCLENVYAALENDESKAAPKSPPVHNIKAAPESPPSYSTKAAPEASQQKLAHSTPEASPQRRASTVTPESSSQRGVQEATQTASPQKRAQATQESLAQSSPEATTKISPAKTPKATPKSSANTKHVAIYNMSTEDFLGMSDIPGRIPPTSAETLENDANEDDQSEDIANVVMDGVADLLARFQAEDADNITTEPCAKPSKIPCAPDDEHQGPQTVTP